VKVNSCQKERRREETAGKRDEKLEAGREGGE